MAKSQTKRGSKEPVEAYVQEIASKLFEDAGKGYPLEARKAEGAINSRLVLMRQKVAAKELAVLEELAQEVSHDALKLGATDLLDTAIKMQGAIRGGNELLARDLMDQLEQDMEHLREFLFSQ